MEELLFETAWEKFRKDIGTLNYRFAKEHFVDSEKLNRINQALNHPTRQKILAFLLREGGEEVRVEEDGGVTTWQTRTSLYKIKENFPIKNGWLKYHLNVLVEAQLISEGGRVEFKNVCPDEVFYNITRYGRVLLEGLMGLFYEFVR